MIISFQSFAGMLPYKRPAADKSGIPVYQPGATYQQLMQLQQPFVPVSCEYPSPSPSATTTIPQTSTANANNNIATVSNSNTSKNNIINNSNSNLVVTTSPIPTPSQVPLNNRLVTSVGSQIISSSSEHTSVNNIISSNNSEQLPELSSVVSAISSASVIPPTSSITLPITSPHVYHPAYSQAHLYDPAALAKEVAQKNYATALKLATSNSLAGKPLTALNYAGVSYNKAALTHQNAMAATLQAQAQQQAAAAAAVRLPHSAYSTLQQQQQQQAVAVAQQQQHQQHQQNLYAHYSRPPPMYAAAAVAQQQHAIQQHQQQQQQLLRPQYPGSFAASNPYAAAAAATGHPFFNQNFLYPGLAGYHQLNAAAAAAAMNVPVSQGVSLNMQSMAGLPSVQQVSSTQTPGSQVVLNPYKKMKTS